MSLLRNSSRRGRRANPPCPPLDSWPSSSQQTIALSWSWADPRLWDVAQPNLYTLRLKVKGAGEYDQKFGVREFWIEGRQYYYPDYRTDFPMGDNPYRYYRW